MESVFYFHEFISTVSTTEDMGSILFHGTKYIHPYEWIQGFRVCPHALSHVLSYS